MTRTPTSERLADEAPVAVLHVLHRALERARLTEGVLELEAPSDPRVADLHRAAKALRKATAALIVELALDAAEVRIAD